MALVRHSTTLPGSVHEAETCWYEVERWPEWVDELARVIEVNGPWPEAGAEVVWESGPAGRGRVTERVIGHEPLAGQTIEIEDETIEGRRWVSFTPAPQGVEVELILEYRIRRRNPLTPLIDVLFIRRLMAGSLERTLARFGGELELSRREGAR